MTKRKANPETAALLRLLRGRFSACQPAIAWVAQNVEFSPEELYKACTRADWLQWLLDVLFWTTNRAIPYATFGDWYVCEGNGRVLSGTALANSVTTKAVHKACCNNYRRLFPYKDVAAQLKARFPR